ncbi:MAG: DUF2905 domain-containing protein [Bacteroidota bacterium]
MMQPFGKMLILLGVVLLGVGMLLTFFDKIPFLGKLPGDIHIKRENFQFYFPITTSVVISVLLSLIFLGISFFSKK